MNKATKTVNNFNKIVFELKSMGSKWRRFVFKTWTRSFSGANGRMNSIMSSSEASWTDLERHVVRILRIWNLASVSTWRCSLFDSVLIFHVSKTWTSSFSGAVGRVNSRPNSPEAPWTYLERHLITILRTWNVASVSTSRCSLSDSVLLLDLSKTWTRSLWCYCSYELEAKLIRSALNRSWRHGDSILRTWNLASVSTGTCSLLWILSWTRFPPVCSRPARLPFCSSCCLITHLKNRIK